LPHFDISAFLIAAVGVLALISLSLLFFARLGVGSIVAFLVAGIAISAIRDVQPSSVIALREFAEIGVVLLLFLIGLEIKPPQLRELGRDAFGLGVPQVVVSALLIGLYIWLTVRSWEATVVLALGFSLSSTVVVLQLLKDHNQLHVAWGRKAFAILLAQDLAVVPLLLTVSLMSEWDATRGGPHWLWAVARAAIVLVGIPVVGRYGLTRVLAIAVDQDNKPAVTCLTLLGVLAAALAAEKAGLSMALGTFLLGATLSVSPLAHRVIAAVEPAQKTLLALFFLSIGLSIDLKTIGQASVALLISIVVILALKFIALWAIGLVRGIGWTDSLRLALALTQCGEFGFVIFNAAQSGNLLNGELSALASVVITVSMLATPFVLRLGGPVSQFSQK
jgi:glutathione-regulated potassium-efflux system ancillary protein KefC